MRWICTDSSVHYICFTPYCKLTIIWASQTGMSAKGANRGVRAPLAPLGCDLGVWGSIVSSPSGVLGGSPAASNFFVYTDKIWANFWPPMRKHTTVEMGKSGQIRDTKLKTRQVGVPGELWFVSGTHLKKLGLSQKVWDGWSSYFIEDSKVSPTWVCGWSDRNLHAAVLHALSVFLDNCVDIWCT